jgi:NADH-quinone oxidoreductase subunit B
VYVVGCPPRPENLFYALLRLQDKIDQMSIAKKPTEVRLQPGMVDNFKEQIRIAQANVAAPVHPEQLVQLAENTIVAPR